jgi:hypothetical protein
MDAATFAEMLASLRRYDPNGDWYDDELSANDPEDILTVACALAEFRSQE